VFLIARPTEAAIRAFLESQRDRDLSYGAIGSTRTTPPAGYTVDHNRVRLGSGAGTFDRASAALRRWQMFQLGWVKVFWPSAPIVVGTDVAVLVRVWGVWSLNACRIIYVVDEETPVRRYGFAYGTLPDHAESGEERFSIEWHLEDDSVWYDIMAFSRPRHVLAQFGYPFARMLQRQFARDSLAAMTRAVAAGESQPP
jgi:uncharacterized protein (UPF0548 family)